MDAGWQSTIDILTRPTVLTLLLAVPLVLLLVQRRNSVSPEQRIEVLGNWKKDDLRDILRTEFLKGSGRAYAVSLPHRTTVVIPPELKQEVGWLSDDDACASADLYDRFMGKYTGFGTYTPNEPGDPIMVDITYAKGPLTKLQDSALGAVYDELEYALKAEAGDVSTSEYKKFTAHKLASQLAVRIFQRIYVGQELSRNEAWLKACATIGMTVGKTAQILARYPAFLRTLAFHLLGISRDFQRAQSDIEAFLRPLQERCIEYGSADGALEPSNFIQHYVNVSSAEKKHDTKNLVKSLVGLNFAGVMSLGFVLCEVILELANRPEYISELRQEVETTKKDLAKARLPLEELNKLYKVDSFIKETLRMNSGSALVMTRKIKRDLQLSNGQLLRAGSYVTTPFENQDRIGIVKGSDPGFDGFRWARKRQESDEGNRYGWVTAGTDTMGFGYGAHACPGRFFAVTAVKAITAELLLKYDFAMADGQVRKEAVINKLLARDLDFVSPVMLKARHA